MNKVAIIQARMSSSRLPGKVMLDIAGKPMLQHVVERAENAKLVDQVVLATTTDPSDDLLERYCQKNGVPCYRGSLQDVLDRFYQAAAQFQADVIIRLTADCPLLDPKLIDSTVSVFLGKSKIISEPGTFQVANYLSLTTGAFDFAANRLPPPWRRTLPIGLDVEVCSLHALQRAWKVADQPYQREHVMPYLYEGIVFPEQTLPSPDKWYIQQGTNPRGFKVAVLNHDPDLGRLRWTVDTPADLEFVRQVFNHLGSQAGYAWENVLSLMESDPKLASINAEVQHKSAFDVDKRTLHS